jgi:hypothetical protein
VFATILVTPDLWSAPAFAALPALLRAHPPALAWLAALPISGPLGRGALVLALVASTAALVGWRTRLSAAVAALTLSYLLGVPQLYGTVRHYHHLVWLAALLAASPSGDALSIEAWSRARRGAPAPAPGPAYGVPLVIAWLLAACIFFFPGLWKLRQSGLGWALSDNLVQQMRWKWLQHGRVPLLRIDLHPRLCQAGALAVLAFELSFPLLLLHRVGRVLALVGAFVFHALTAFVMFIGFGSLLCLYVALVPWHRLARRPSGSASVPVARACWPVGALLVVGAATAGVLGAVQAWPFACYPTFQFIAPPLMPALEVELVDRDGVRDLLSQATLPGVDGQRAWALSWALAAAPRAEAIRAWLLAWAQREPRLLAARQIEVFRVLRPVDPARWRERGQERVRLLALAGVELR